MFHFPSPFSFISKYFLPTLSNFISTDPIGFRLYDSLAISMYDELSRLENHVPFMIWLLRSNKEIRCEWLMEDLKSMSCK